MEELLSNNASIDLLPANHQRVYESINFADRKASILISSFFAVARMQAKGRNPGRVLHASTIPDRYNPCADAGKIGTSPDSATLHPRYVRGVDQARQ